MENIDKAVSDLKSSYQNDLRKQELTPDEIHIKYLGKKGAVNTLLQEVNTLPQEEKIPYLKKINAIKEDLEKQLTEKRERTSKKEQQKIDLTMPAGISATGNLHPLTLVKRDLYNFFHYYGFSVYEGPEIETDFYNFEMLGVPKDHPARELQDTLYVLEPDYLLRTQTSSIEARVLDNMKPPIRFVVGDRAYRNETTNRNNGALFHQFQGVYVDRNVTIGNLKWIFTKSLKHILGDNTTIRFRAKYYPEVEPGISPDILCWNCGGEGCEVCKKRGWIEIAGGGMIHPNILEKAGIDSKVYSGFAFGWGLDRIAMAVYGIKDLRVLYDGSLTYENTIKVA